MFPRSPLYLSPPLSLLSLQLRLHPFDSLSQQPRSSLTHPLLDSVLTHSHRPPLSPAHRLSSKAEATKERSPSHTSPDTPTPHPLSPSIPPPYPRPPWHPTEPPLRLPQHQKRPLHHPPISPTASSAGAAVLPLGTLVSLAAAYHPTVSGVAVVVVVSQEQSCPGDAAQASTQPLDGRTARPECPIGSSTRAPAPCSAVMLPSYLHLLRTRERWCCTA